MIVVWDFPNQFTLQTPLGTLVLNSVHGDGSIFLVQREGSSVDRPLRVTVDNIPQGSGEILHRRFTQGYKVTLNIEMWKTPDGSIASALPACDGDLQDMIDTLMGHVEAALNAADARLIWTPPGHAPRALINMRWLGFPTQEPQDAGLAVSVQFDTPFPYAIGYTQTTPALGTPVTNGGNADFYPVLHIDGPSSAFLVANGTLGLGLVYDSARPGGIALGGGDYAEIDCFRNTIVLNGDVQDLDAGVDPLLSTFFWMLPGVNTTVISGATGYVLMNDAWA